jgi:23S rRNA pseudouridine1911/1915/1917 synthase
MNYYEPLEYIVKPEEEGMLLRTVLLNRLNVSRKLISRLKLTEQGITVNGERRYTSSKVAAGDRVEIRMQEEQSDDIMPQELPLSIIYEDDHLLVVNKAAGIIVHPTHGHYMNTLANAVVYHWQQTGCKSRFRPIHRLDQDTSGTLAIAKNPFVHQQVSEQMQANTVTKQYLAIVHGIMEHDAGTVNELIDRDQEQPHLRIVTPSGYPAVTHYKVERRFAAATLVRLTLETGRTHQIRVHMLHLGHPLFGDSMYGLSRLRLVTGDAADAAGDAGRHTNADTADAAMGRQALHACLLAFRHPFTRERMEFTAELPEDMRSCLEQL